MVMEFYYSYLVSDLGEYCYKKDNREWKNRGEIDK